MGTQKTHLPEEETNRLGEKILDYVKLLSLFSLGVLLLIILDTIFHSPLLMRGLIGAQLLRNYQIYDYLIQGLYIIAWAAFFYFLLPVFNEIAQISKTHPKAFRWLVLALGWVMIGYIVSFVVQCIRLVNFIQYYSTVREIAAQTPTNFQEMVGYLLYYAYILDFSTNLMIVPASLITVGSIIMAGWAYVRYALTHQKFSFAVMWGGSLIQLLGAILLLLKAAFDLKAWGLDFWFWLGGTLLFIWGFNKIGNQLKVYSNR